MAGKQHLLLFSLATVVACAIAHKIPSTAKPGVIITSVIQAKPPRDDLLDFLAAMGDTGGMFPGFGGFGGFGSSNRRPNRGFGYGGRRFGPAYQGPGSGFNTRRRSPTFGGRRGSRGGRRVDSRRRDRGFQRDSRDRRRRDRGENSSRRDRSRRQPADRRRRRDDSFGGPRRRDVDSGTSNRGSTGGRTPLFPSIFNFGNRRRPSGRNDRGFGGRFPFFNFGGFGGDRRGDRGDDRGGRRFPSFNFGNRFPFFGPRRDRDRGSDGGFGGGRRDSDRGSGRRRFFPFGGFNPFAGVPRGGGQDRGRDRNEGRDRPSFPAFRPFLPDRRDDRRDDGRDDRMDDRRGDRGRGVPDFRNFRGQFPSFFRDNNDRGVSRDVDVFGVSANDDNFVGSREERDQNICTEKRNYKRPAEPDTDTRQRTGSSSSCSSTRSTRICSSSYIKDGVEHIEEKISRCCPGTVATDRGCVRRSMDRASEQIRQFKSNVFLDFVRRADLQQLLDANNTVFVPTDKAFQHYLRKYTAPSDTAAIRHLLYGHIVEDNLPLPLVSVREQSTETKAGPLLISMGASGPLINCQPLINRDQPTPQGGLIHTVGGVLQSQNTSLLGGIQADPRLSKLYELLVETGLASELKLLTSVTLLAPTNDALAAASLPQDQALLKQILRAHIISGIQCSQGLPGVGLNARGEPVFLFPRGPQSVLVAPRLQRQSAATVRLVTPDVVTRAGLLQVIDKVIIPPFAVPTLTTLSRLEGTKHFTQLLTSAGLGPAVNRDNITILIPPPSQLPTISLISDSALRATLSPYILQSGLYGGPFPAHIQDVSGQQVLLTGRNSTLLGVQCIPIQGRLDLGKPTVHVLGVGGLIVPATQTLLGVIQNRKDLSNFAQLVRLAGLEARLSAPDETLTVLAPDNVALPSIAGISAAQAAAIVNSHVMSTIVCTASVGAVQASYPNLGGGELAGSVVGTSVVFAPVGGGAPVLTVKQKDVIAKNGVLHVVDRYLQPAPVPFKKG